MCGIESRIAQLGSGYNGRRGSLLAVEDIGESRHLVGQYSLLRLRFHSLDNVTASDRVDRVCLDRGRAGCLYVGGYLWVSSQETRAEEGGDGCSGQRLGNDARKNVVLRDRVDGKPNAGTLTAVGKHG